MYRIILDTETCGELDCPFVYDVGFSIIDEYANVVKTFSFINKDFFEDADLMKSAYYAEKIPQYLADIEKGIRTVKTLEEIYRIFRWACRKWNVTEFIAHNMRFDYNSLTNTRRYETTSAKRFWFPYNSRFIDTLKMARTHFKGDNDYREFCLSNGYVTKNNQNRYTAEIIYRYITGNNEFEEAHKGLDDVLIELEIFRYCFETLEQGYLFEK